MRPECYQSQNDCQGIYDAPCKRPNESRLGQLKRTCREIFKVSDISFEAAPAKVLGGQHKSMRFEYIYPQSCEPPIPGLRSQLLARVPQTILPIHRIFD
jgi:hypothetical protein